jgi:hypothetical protein
MFIVKYEVISVNPNGPGCQNEDFHKAIVPESSFARSPLSFHLLPKSDPTQYEVMSSSTGQIHTQKTNASVSCFWYLVGH